MSLFELCQNKQVSGIYGLKEFPFVKFIFLLKTSHSLPQTTKDNKSKLKGQRLISTNRTHRVANILIFSIKYHKRLSDWGRGEFPSPRDTEGMRMSPDVLLDMAGTSRLAFPSEFQHHVMALPT